MSPMVSDSTPDSTSSRTMPSTCATSTGVTTLPRASSRSVASRVSDRSAGGSGLIMMIQPASGPGVCERARCRICLKPVVVISPTRAPLLSSTAFVATVVPCTMFCSSDGSIPASAQMRLRPVSTPSEGSAGVEGVLTRNCLSSESLTRNRSVNVPPTSTPRRNAISRPLSCSWGLLQLGDLRGREAELAEHVVVVGPDRPARAVAHAAGGSHQLRDDAVAGDRAVHLVLPLDHEAALAEPGVAMDVRGRVDGRADDARGVHDLVQLGGRVLRRPLADEVVEQRLVLAARGVVGEALVLAPLRVIHERGEALPERVVVGRDHDPLAVARAVDVGGRDLRQQ